VAQVAHDLHALFVQGGLFGVAAVYHRPVGGADQRHLAELGNLFQGFQCAGGAGAAGAGNNSSGLLCQQAACAVAQPVHEAQHAGSGGGIMYRSTKHNAVGLFHQRQNINDWPAEYAVSGFGAAAAAHTAAHRDSANVVDGGFDAVSVQSLGNLLQSSVCTAMCVRAAVDKKYVHNRYASVLRKKLLLRGKLVHRGAHTRNRRSPCINYIIARPKKC